ncbi:2-methylisocitrate lyase-like PEP mutase family enzyme [Friedmanniella endophytica]|uniref:2-methylisocitrate lyase-like PEP mutase family enzyme n=1 Tax=Microlunatus kandeliicorticis TaxID=1759536 RepID=A0A7W3ISP1_9ACTN|nr:isocitrate lyase/phosphoenolpyruvate mutase family protein [Microlunatus kandeliicorticis]MBA8794455.1 2-methylisocitrate lyase-like PEP mutase family enzyme [Microlunatus kandeliicorticis]
MTTAERAQRLLELHRAPQILTLVNVWDVISARVVADLPGTTAIATASHSIAASLGYEDGERIPVELMIEAVGRIAAATDLPTTADLEAGYGDAGETVRRAIDVGVVGANLEDQLNPLPEAVAAVRKAVAVGTATGVPFVVNARTDAWVRGGDRPADVVLADAIERGRAYLDAGATTVFAPGLLDRDTVAALVEALGPQRLSLILLPGGLTVAEMAELGVSRVTVGPWGQRIALTAFADAAVAIMNGGAIPEGTRPLN